MIKISPKILVFEIVCLLALTGLFFFGIFKNSLAQNNITFESKNQIIALEEKIALKIAEVSDRTITLEWQTPEKTKSTIYYGQDQSNLNQISDNAFLKSHKISLFNLTPETKYFIKVRSLGESDNQYDSEIKEITTLKDQFAPLNVSQIAISKNEQEQMVLSWKNPPDPDFKEVIVKEDNQEVYRGNAANFALSPGSQEKRLFFIVSADQSGNLSGGASFIVSNGTILKDSEKFEDLNLPKNNIYIFNIFESGGKFLLSPLNKTALNLISVYSEDRIQFSFDPALFKKQISAAYLEAEGIRYSFKLNGRYFQTDFALPNGSAENFKAHLQIEFSDKTKQAAVFDFLIKNRPKVFENVAGEKKALSGAQVSLYWQNPNSNQFELWAGSLFNQANPVFINEKGEYSFYVLPGIYKLKVFAQGYKNAETEIFSVSDGSAVLNDIELFKDEPPPVNNYNETSLNNTPEDKNSGKKFYRQQSFNKTIEMLPMLIFIMLGFFVVIGSIVGLVLLKLHLPHYHAIKKQTEEIHKDLIETPKVKQ